jgi:glucose/arabinose dehydrogenase
MRNLLALLPLSIGTLLGTPVFGPDVDASQFVVTPFATQLSFPQSMISMSGGAIAVQTSPGFSNGVLVTLTDTNSNGIADQQGTLYTAPAGEGALTQLAQAGSFYVQGNYGAHSIVILNSSFAEAGRIQFDYGQDLWWHDTIGFTVRPTPGQSGFYDVVFNVGSQYDNEASVMNVGASNLVNASLNPDSLYMVTLDLNGTTPVASNLTQVAKGIRNSFGLAFDSDGSLWFTDNAMDGDPFPPQAEELNEIPAALLNALQADTPGATPLDFGFPTCYPNYFTGSHDVSGCTEPIQSFLPFLGMYSQGATQIAFAPPDFPPPYNHGIFIAFAGNPPGQRNPLIFYNLDTGEYTHFLLGGNATRQTGLLATGNSLFISDFLSGEIFQITAATPEPGTFALAGLVLAGLALRLAKQNRA